MATSGLLQGRILSELTGSIMNRTVVGLGGALALAAMMLSTTSGQTQTQTNTQTAVQGQHPKHKHKLHFIWNLSFRLSGGRIERFVERWQPEYQFQYLLRLPIRQRRSRMCRTSMPQVLRRRVAKFVSGRSQLAVQGPDFGLTIGGTSSTANVSCASTRERWQFWDIPWQRVRQCASIQTCAKRCWQPAHRALATDMLMRQVAHIGGLMWLIRGIPTLLRRCKLSQEQIEPRQTVSAPAATPGSQPGCRTEWQLFSGWYVVCDGRVLRTSRRRRLIQSKASRRCNKPFGQNQRLLLDRRKRTIGNP